MNCLRRRTFSLSALAGAAATLGAAVYSSASYALDDGAVVTSIKPIHSLVSGVMEGVGKPHLIVRGAASPHTYSLRPSDAGRLQEAKVIFWIGRNLEPFLEKPLESLGQEAALVALSDASGLVKLPFREGGPFEKHDHGDHGDEHGHEDEHAHKDEHDHHEAGDKHEDHAHDKHDHDKHDHDDHTKEHAHDEHDHAKEHDHDEHDHAKEHDHDEHGHEEHAHEEGHHDEHDHGEFDVHFWLDPQNAKAMVYKIEETLVEMDPKNADLYEANADRLARQLDQMTDEVTAELAPVKGRPFIVFHDAYQYFERRFGVTAAGSITVSPEIIPGAQRVAEIKARVAELGGTCVFSEPQFEPKLVQVVTEGTTARSGVLDPLGAGLEEGPGLYFQLIRNMSGSVKDCLAGNS